MAFSPRLIALSALGAAPLLLFSGCGGSASEARQTVVAIQPTSYVTLEPITTTTTTTTLPGATTPGGGTSPTEQEYTIQAGDYLSKIADLYGVANEDICNYNQWTDCVDPPHLLLPGDKIKIPPNASVPGSGGTDTGVDTGATNPPTPTTEAPASVACTYTIAAGDTPSQVAGKHGISFNELQRANPQMDMSTTFVVGDTINIPEPGTC